MALTIHNGAWLLSETSDSKEYKRILKTAGTVVDKDIHINLSAKQGSITFEQQNLKIEPAIQKDSASNKYVISINENVMVSPIITEGWVSEAESSIIHISGLSEINATELTKKLQPSDDISGYSSYIFTATKGYNEQDLKDGIDVYQGHIQD